MEAMAAHAGMPTVLRVFAVASIGPTFNKVSSDVYEKLLYPNAATPNTINNTPTINEAFMGFPSK